MKKSSHVAKIAKIETDWSFEEAPITEGPHWTTKWRQQGSASAEAEEETSIYETFCVNPEPSTEQAPQSA